MLSTELVTIVTAGSYGKSPSSVVTKEAKCEVGNNQYAAFPLNEPDLSQAIDSCTETVVKFRAGTSL